MGKRKTRSKQDIPKDESKADRFIRVVTPRVGKAVKAIRQISYCAGSGYEHSDEQLKQILDILDTARNALADAYSKPRNTESEFTFKD